MPSPPPPHTHASLLVLTMLWRIFPPLCSINIVHGATTRKQGEFTCAREFYRYVSATCECVEGERAASTRDHYERGAEGADGRENQTGLTRYEACWSARAEFGVASLELRECTAAFAATYRDDNVAPALRMRAASDVSLVHASFKTIGCRREKRYARDSGNISVCRSSLRTDFNLQDKRVDGNGHIFLRVFARMRASTRYPSTACTISHLSDCRRVFSAVTADNNSNPSPGKG